MSGSATLNTVRSRVGPLVIGAGMAMVAVAYVGYSADHHHPQVAAPPPSVTTLTPQPTAPTPKPTKRRSAPKPMKPRPPSPRQTNPPAPVVAVRQPGSSRTSGSMAQALPATVAPSRPSPAPPPAAESCSGNVLAVQVLRAACVSIGGSR